MKFYAFNDDDGDTVNLFLDHNTTALVQWNDSYYDENGMPSNVNGPDNVLEQLKSDTAVWQGVESPTKYNVDQDVQTGRAKYIINYRDGGYNARLITIQYIDQITKNTSWNESILEFGYFFDTKTSNYSETCERGNTSGCKYGRLYDRTDIDCKKYGCSNNADLSMKGNGYWTFSASPYSSYAWGVDYKGGVPIYYDLEPYQIKYSFQYGVRPVIEILKSKLD